MSKVTAKLVEGFLNGFMMPDLDTPAKTPEFHREMWRMVCSESKRVAIAAPRGHAKTTAVTMAYILANVLFCEREFVLLVSNTWDISTKFLSIMKEQLYSNDDLKKHFGPFNFEKDTQDEIVVSTPNGKFCIIARGSEQNVRGLQWMSKRPDLIVCDDLESDELVNNPERRKKFSGWFMNLLMPCGSRSCIYRVVGTILHFDSVLENLLADPSWNSRRFSAHKGFDDFSEILWPDMWPEERLREVRQMYISQHNMDGYSQEYLNIPVSTQDQYFRPEDMLETEEEDRHKEMIYYAAADLAISKTERSDYTVIGVMGVDSNNFKHIVDIRRGRWDSLQIIDELISVNKRYKPEIFGMERGQIEKAIGPFLDIKMRETGEFLNLKPLTPSGDKPTRAKSFQAMHKAGAIKFDKEASWYLTLEDEMMKFTNSGAKSGHDDQIDVMAYLGMIASEIQRPNTILEDEEEEYWEYKNLNANDGRNAITGY